MSVRVSSGDGQWMEVRIFGFRFWVCNDSFTTTTLFLRDYGDLTEAASENAEELESVAEMIGSYFSGSFVEHRDRKGRIRRRVSGPNGQLLDFYAAP